MSGPRPVIHWFRHDLRLSDNPALAAAAEVGGPVIPVYVLDDPAPHSHGPGAASRWWLHGSLSSLDRSLRDIGSRLVLRRGSPVTELLAIAAETGASAIHFTRGYEPRQREQEQALKEACASTGGVVRRFAGAALFEPEAIRTRNGDAYRVFTPFWKACTEVGVAGLPLAAPRSLLAPREWPGSEALKSWRLLPTKPDWAGGMREAWTPGEAAAIERLTRFLDGPVAGYPTDRDRPDLHGTSRLSPHLHFGEISPRQCWHAARTRAAADPSRERGIGSFVREIGWREFSLHLLFHWPHIVDRPFREEFRTFPWSEDAQANAAALAAWQRGRTGYPIVDAGMRELWQTGWMHNRVRMIVASLLTKHLLVPWQSGAAWFLDTLVDADLASNQASWQWVAGCGADAAPYFRVFNPVLQGAKFDPDGAYVRRYVPELARLPAAHIHAPWLAPPEVLKSADVTLGSTYPRPIVDHAQGRARALAAYARLKGEAAHDATPGALP
jgi:deoxyribodipyrimidine photo-lyase